MAARACYSKAGTGSAGVLLLAGATFLASVVGPAQAASAQLPDVHYRTAIVQLDRGNEAKAEVALKLALQGNPLDARAHLLLATLLAQRGEIDLAIVGLQRAATLDPQAVALYNLGTLLLSRGEPVQAARMLEAAIQARPDHVPAHNNLAKAYYLSGLPELAAAGYGEALRLDSSNGLARANLALLTAAAVDANGPADPARGSGDPGPGEVGGARHRSPDAERMIEVDATLFAVATLESRSEGFNFLRLVRLNFDYFASDHDRDGSGYQAPGDIGAVSDLAQQGWLLVASVDYLVNIANAADDRVAVLARPHLTTLSGTPATFLAGGEFVFEVSGLNSGDIKPYPFGTTLKVTPALLSTPAADGTPRVHITVEVGRTSVLELLASDDDQLVAFEKFNVSSQAVLAMGQTLIHIGHNQRESRTGRNGVPGLRSVPLLKYFFSTRTTAETNSAVILLLTPRDPAFMDERNRTAISAFVAQRRAFVRALRGGEEAVREFRERYPEWYRIPPNRYGSHVFLMNRSEAYRAISGEELAAESLDFEILRRKPRNE